MPKSPTQVGTDFSWSYGSVAPITGQTGTGGNVIADVTATPAQAQLNTNFKVLADKINAIIAVLQSNGTLQ